MATDKRAIVERIEVQPAHQPAAKPEDGFGTAIVEGIVILIMLTVVWIGITFINSLLPPGW